MKNMKMGVIISTFLVIFTYGNSCRAITFSAAVTDSITNGYELDDMAIAIGQIEAMFWLSVSAGIAILDESIPAKVDAESMIAEIELFEADETVVGPRLTKLFLESKKQKVELNLDRIYEKALMIAD